MALYTESGAWMFAFTVIRILGIFTLVACSNSNTLDATSWRLKAWSVSSLSPSEYTITAQFDEGRISGTSGVNSYSGEYKTGSGGSFEVGDIAQTMMAGSDDAMRAESIYHELLSAASSYQLDQTTLTLFDADGNESLIFSAAAE
ncbi:MAG: META domain-containing protein [Coriobacteriia bacterium]|jgi:heat shock protein HslJ|nr:META domain-containing protein [Coriobacteriia bacterium]